MRYLTVTVCAAALGLAATAHGSGLDAPLIGPAAAGPLSRGAAAVWHNPAALTRVRRAELSFGAELVLGGIGYTRERRGRYQKTDSFTILDPVDASVIDPGLTGEAEPTGALIAMPAGDLFLALPVHDRVTLGLGVYSPYAAPVAYDADGPQRWSLQEAFIAVVHLTGAVGVRVHDRVSLGAGVTAVAGQANMKRVQDFAALDAFGEALAGPPANQPNSFGTDAPTTVRELDVLGRPVSITDAAAANVTFHVGVYAEPTDDLRLGLTYHHGAPLTFEGDFALDFSDDFFTADLSPSGLAFPELVEGTARLALTLPKRIELAGAYRVSRYLELEGRLEYVTWSDLESLRIALKSPQLAQPAFGLPDVSHSVLARNWDDAVHLMVLGHLSPPGSMRMSWGLGYQSPASPDETVDVASPDGHRVQLRGQATLPLAGDLADPDWALAVHAGLDFIVPRTVTTSAHDLGNGTYSMAVGTLGAHATWRWGQ